MACDIFATQNVKKKFQAVSREMCTLAGQAPTRIEMGLDTFFNPFVKFFEEFSKKKDVDGALQYFNGSFPEIKKKAEAVLTYVWGVELKSQLNLEKFKIFNLIWSGPEVIDEAGFASMKFKIEDAMKEIKSLCSKVKNMVDKLNKSFGPEISHKEYMKDFEALSAKLDKIK